MRLTEKNNTGYLTSQKYFPSKEFENKNELESAALLLNKLGKLEDLEEELEIDLITLFKALQDGIWVKKTIVENREIKNLFFFYEDVNLYKDRLYACPVDIYDERVCIYQYGKTWALTKEELIK